MALALVLLVGTAGCSDADSSGANVNEGGPGATADEPDPVVEVESDAASFVLPVGFSLTGSQSDAAPVVASDPSGASVSLVEVELAGTPPALDRQEAVALAGLGAKFTAEQPIVVDEVEMWHLTSPDSRGQDVDVYGAVVDGTSVRLTIRLGNDEYDEAERAAVNEQVLASWSWA